MKALLALGLIAVAHGQNLAERKPIDGTKSQELVDFTFERLAPLADTWRIEVAADLTATYSVLPRGEPQAIFVSATEFETIGAAVRRVEAGDCETKQKNIAQSGKKTMKYRRSPSEAWHECSFNYSDDSRLNEAASVFQGLSETMHEGEKLRHDRRFDRLGMDAEMDVLVDEVKRGDALEVRNIAPVLQEIIADDAVMERVRRKAAILLEGSGVTTHVN